MDPFVDPETTKRGEHHAMSDTTKTHHFCHQGSSISAQ